MELRVAVLLLMWVQIAFSQRNMRLDEITVKLTQPSTTKEASASLAELGRSDPAVKSYLSVKLPSLLLNESNTFVVQTEAALAGTLGITAAEGALIELLNRPNRIFESRTLTTAFEMHDDPVVRALYDLHVHESDLATPLEEPTPRDQEEDRSAARSHR